MGVHKWISYGQLVCFGRHYECWKVYKVFRATYAPLQTTCISAGQCKTTHITTAWLHSRRVWVLNWPACSPDLSPIKNIWRIIKRKIRQIWPRTLQQLETYIRQEWDQIPTPKLQKLDAQMSSNYLEKKRRCYTMVNMPPSYRQASNLKWANFVQSMFYCKNTFYLL